MSVWNDVGGPRRRRRNRRAQSVLASTNRSEAADGALSEGTISLFQIWFAAFVGGDGLAEPRRETQPG